jgi:hypothetical protein
MPMTAASAKENRGRAWRAGRPWGTRIETPTVGLKLLPVGPAAPATARVEPWSPRTDRERGGSLGHLASDGPRVRRNPPRRCTRQTLTSLESRRLTSWLGSGASAPRPCPCSRRASQAIVVVDSAQRLECRTDLPTANRGRSNDHRHRAAFTSSPFFSPLFPNDDSRCVRPPAAGSRP